MPADPPEPWGSLRRGGPVRVATIPFADSYVDAVLPPDAVRVGPSGEFSPWLDVAHLAEHAAEVDVLHLHTGPGDVAVVAGQCWAETVRRLGIPLVVTVHSLPAPAGGCPPEPAMDAHLAAVLSTAEVVLTLTPGAADEIAERFGRTAIVVALPSLVAPDPGLGAERGLVGCAWAGSRRRCPIRVPWCARRCRVRSRVEAGCGSSWMRPTSGGPPVPCASWPRSGTWSSWCTRRRTGPPSCSNCTWRCCRSRAGVTRTTSRSAGTSAPASFRRAADGSPASGPTSCPTAITNRAVWTRSRSPLPSGPP